MPLKQNAAPPGSRRGENPEIRNFALNSGHGIEVEPDVKIKFVTGMLAVVFSLAFRMVSAQITGPLPAPNTGRPAIVVACTNHFSAASKTLPVLWLNRPSASPPPKPGVYLTKPYACMVLVPGAQPDDRIFNEARKSPPIPTAKPDLQLVPKIADGK